MQTYTYTVAGTETVTHVPTSREEIAGFRDFLARGDKVLGLDTETTDLDMFSPGHGLRLVQFGNDDEAWVLRAGLFADVITDTLRQDRMFVAHNAPFDLLVLDRHLGVTVEELGARVFDTRILAHLLDPRSEHEGGTGLGLKPLSAVYVDDSAPDTAKGLYEVFRRDYGATKSTGWALIDIADPTYNLYAGLDVILVSRLLKALVPLVKGAGLSGLSKFEHHLMVILAVMQRRGVLVDVPYATSLHEELLEEAEQFRGVAARYGVENVNATSQVSEALVAMGEELTERTAAGALKVNKTVLLPLADLDNHWGRIGAREPNPLADAVVRAKRADKWAVSYSGAFLSLRDGNDRLHPFIGGLQARTARMSISRPPLQQLPSTDWRIRRAMIADPGQLIISSDYDQIEMRVLAALADERKMQQAIRDGVDLHDFTTELVYGEVTPGKRKLMKGVGFGKVYGGGAVTLARQTGTPVDQVKRAIRGYDSAFPGIRKYGERLQRQARFGAREVVTETGRHLPLDRDRLYSATNYAVQSLSRDMLAQALVDLFAAGLGDHLLLPVHDEIVAQAPREDAEDVARAVGETMTRMFKGVPVTSTGEVVGPSWGHAYGAPDDESEEA